MYKQITLLVLFSVFAGHYSGFAQAPASAQAASATATEYVRVHANPFLLKKNYTVYLSFGRDDNSDQHITDEAGNKMEFRTPTGIINYMSSLGWEFVAYIPDDEGKLSSRVFLMRRNLQTP